MGWSYDKGKMLNPSADTDSSGNFTIIADRRFWKESGKFTLGINIRVSEVFPMDSNNVLIMFEVDENTNKIEVGDLVVKR